MTGGALGQKLLMDFLRTYFLLSGKPASSLLGFQEIRLRACRPSFVLYAPSRLGSLTSCNSIGITRLGYGPINSLFWLPVSAGRRRNGTKGLDKCFGVQVIAW